MESRPHDAAQRLTTGVWGRNQPSPCPWCSRSVMAVCLTIALMADDKTTPEALLAAIKRNAEKSEENAGRDAASAALTYAQAARELADALNASGLKLRP